MARLSLDLLGPPRARYGDRPIRFPTRKAEAILLYLAAEGGTHSREKIISLFWPDSDAEHGRGSLRSTLGLLRVALRDAADGDDHGHLTAGRETLRFNATADTRLDLDFVRSAVSRARESSPGLSLGLIAELRAATPRYRDEFLSGFSLGDAPAFDEWVVVQREAWRRQIDHVFDRLSQELFEGGELAEAIDVTTRWIAVEPLNESAYRRLMRLQAASRDRTAALRTYEACRRILESELNAEPSPETTALAEQIRLDRTHRRERHPRESAVPADVDAPLVGRLAEHARLVASYRAARRGQTRVVLVEGEPGIGKTRLAAAFLRWAAAHGAGVLQGRAFALGSGVPYHVVVEALRGWLAREENPRRALPDVWLAEIGRLLPEVRERCPDLPDTPSMTDGDARNRLYEGVARLGRVLAKRAPLILFVDDLQWADSASLEVIPYLTRRWSAASVPAVLLLTVRSEDLATSATLKEWIAALGRDAPIDRLDLGPLTLEDTAKLVAGLRIRGRGPAASSTDDAKPGMPPMPEVGPSTASPGPLARWLFAQTGGQPLFLMETVRALSEQGVLRASADGTWEAGALPMTSAPARSPGFLAPGVGEVIRTRLARLGGAAQRILGAAAVLDGEFGFDSLRGVAGLSEEDGLAALDELLAHDLLREEDARYTFGHARIRDVASADLGDARRRVFHRRALETLERRSSPAAELARHAWAAGESERARLLSVRAGDDALRIFAVRDAIEHYERALGDPSTQYPAPDTQSTQHLLSQLGRAYELATQYAEARSTYDAMLRLARASRDAVGECAALNRLATLTSLDGGLDRESPVALLERALFVAEESGDTAGLIDTEFNLSRLSMYRFDLPGIQTHGERALELARQHGLVDHAARTLNWLALTAMPRGRWVRARGDAEEARELFVRLGNRAMEADSLVQLAAALIRSGLLNEGIAAARAAQAVGRELENAWSLADAERELALGLLERGAYEEALATARTSVSAARVAGNMPLLLICLGVLGSVCRELGLVDEAGAAHGEETAIAEASQYPLFLEAAPAELCADAAMAGQWDVAVERAREALRRRHPDASFVGLTRWCEIEALVRVGEIALAEADVRAFGDWAAESPRYRIPYLRSQAVLAAARGELATANDHLDDAARLAEEIGLPGESWQIWEKLADLHRARGDEESGRRCAVRAREIASSLIEAIGDQTLRQAFRQRVARL